MNIKQSQKNSLIEMTMLFAKVVGAINMIMDTYAIALANVVTPTFGNVFRAIILVATIDVVMMAFWLSVDYTSDSEENRPKKIGAVAITWAMYIGQIVIGVNSFGAAGIVARIAVGGALAYSTQSYIMDLWRAIARSRKQDTRPITEKMMALRVGVWNTVYAVSPFIALPFLAIIATVKLTRDMLRDASELGKHYEPVVRGNQRSPVRHTPQQPRPATAKPKTTAQNVATVGQSSTSKENVDRIRAISNNNGKAYVVGEKLKDLQAESPYLGRIYKTRRGDQWRLECPVCPNYSSKVYRSAKEAGNAWGGHVGSANHKFNEVDKATPDEKRHNVINGADRRKQSSPQG